MKKNLIIVGAGGHGNVIYDIAKKSANYERIHFLDDNCTCSAFPDSSILGAFDLYPRYIENSDFFIAIGNSALREKMQNCLELAGASCPVLIHPSAVVGLGVTIGAGSVVMPGAVINPLASIGKGVIINTCSSVDHNSVIGDFSHISVGSHIAGDVKIGKACWIGIGAVVSNLVTITDQVMVGAGATVIRSIKESGTYVGVPARKIK